MNWKWTQTKVLNVTGLAVLTFCTLFHLTFSNATVGAIAMLVWSVAQLFTEGGVRHKAISPTVIGNGLAAIGALLAAAHLVSFNTADVARAAMLLSSGLNLFTEGGVIDGDQPQPSQSGRATGTLLASLAVAVVILAGLFGLLLSSCAMTSTNGNGHLTIAQIRPEIEFLRSLARPGFKAIAGKYGIAPEAMDSVYAAIDPVIDKALDDGSLDAVFDQTVWGFERQAIIDDATRALTNATYKGQHVVKDEATARRIITYGVDILATQVQALAHSRSAPKPQPVATPSATPVIGGGTSF